MNKTILVALAACGLGGAITPAIAHHSFAMFDARQTFTANVVVTEFQWSNPHCWLEVEVPGGKGAHKNYKHLSLELTALGSLKAAGWGPRTLNPGDKVQISYHPMRDGTAAGQLLTVKLAKGTVLKGQ
ncbi:MAG TPA: DUF6152 family protein [Novosphingobium sp.]|nr:DUF6152 family protein [Novosphingobium sp.]